MSLFSRLWCRLPKVGLTLLPYYVAVSAVYGSLAYFTDSKVPSMMLHAGGNVVSAFDLFTRGRSEWQPSTGQPRLIWETGPDAAFIGTVVGLLVVSALTVWAFAGLSGATQTDRVARAT